jgi:D-sedoheptulose 7-phosphate isomerase
LYYQNEIINSWWPSKFHAYILVFLTLAKMTDMKLNQIKNNFIEARDLLDKFIESDDNMNFIAQAGNKMVKALNNGNKIISCGNGGSMCDAMHFAEELTGRFRDNRAPIPAIAISDPTYISCTANDYGYDKVFSRFVESLGNEGDILLVISTSGNSTNVINAAEAARAKKMYVIGLTGKDGGKLSAVCDLEIRIPHSGYADRIQEIHIKIINIAIETVENILQL